ncbi:chemotaxis protein CheW [Planctomycetota bacterium]
MESEQTERFDFGEKGALAGPEDPAHAVGDGRSGFVFSVSGNLYGIDLEEVETAVGLSDIVPLPWAPHHVLGVMRIRGAFEAIVSLERILGTETDTDAGRAGSGATRPRVLLIRSGGLKAGLLVDRIEDVTDVGTLGPCPAGARGQVAVFSRGVVRWRDDFICWLSAERILNGTRVQA